MKRSTFDVYSQWCEVQRAESMTHMQRVHQEVAQAQEQRERLEEAREALEARYQDAMRQGANVLMLALLDQERRLLEGRMAEAMATLDRSQEKLTHARQIHSEACTKVAVRDRIHEKLERERIEGLLRREQRELDEVGSRLSRKQP